MSTPADEAAPDELDPESDLGQGRDAFLRHVKHEVTELVDEMLLTLSVRPDLEIDEDLARLMSSMDELLRIYQASDASVPTQAESLAVRAGKPTRT